MKPFAKKDPEMDAVSALMGAPDEESAEPAALDTDDDEMAEGSPEAKPKQDPLVLVSQLRQGLSKLKQALSGV